MGNAASALVKKTVDVGEYSVLVERLLGEGGFGHVYLTECIQPDHGRKMVLKRMRLASDNDSGIAIARQEISILSSISVHPNIVSLISFNEHNERDMKSGILYTVFDLLIDYADSGSAHDEAVHFSKNRHIIPCEKTLLFRLRDTCLALAHLHSQNPPICHRDIKPENLLLHNNTSVKLGLFAAHSKDRSTIGKHSRNGLISSREGQVSTESFVRGASVGSSPEMFFDRQRTQVMLCDFGSAVRTPIPVTVQNLYDLEQAIERTTTLPYRSPELVDIRAVQLLESPTNIAHTAAQEKSSGGLLTGPNSGKSLSSEASELDVAADIWALGCTFYKLAFFTGPFDDPATGATNKLGILSGKFTLPSNSPFSKEFHQLIEACLTVSPTARPNIAEVLLLAAKIPTWPGDTHIQPGTVQSVVNIFANHPFYRGVRKNWAPPNQANGNSISRPLPAREPSLSFSSARKTASNRTSVDKKQLLHQDSEPELITIGSARPLSVLPGSQHTSTSASSLANVSGKNSATGKSFSVSSQNQNSVESEIEAAFLAFSDEIRFPGEPGSAPSVDNSTFDNVFSTNFSTPPNPPSSGQNPVNQAHSEPRSSPSDQWSTTDTAEFDNFPSAQSLPNPISPPTLQSVRSLPIPPSNESIVATSTVDTWGSKSPTFSNDFSPSFSNETTPNITVAPSVTSTTPSITPANAQSSQKLGNSFGQSSIFHAEFPPEINADHFNASPSAAHAAGAVSPQGNFSADDAILLHKGNGFRQNVSNAFSTFSAKVSSTFSSNTGVQSDFDSKHQNYASYGQQNSLSIQSMGKKQGSSSGVFKGSNTAAILKEAAQARVLQVVGSSTAVDFRWVLKATSLQPGPPKSKYVRRIVLDAWENNSAGPLPVHLPKRPVDTEPVVALKACILILKLWILGPLESVAATASLQPLVSRIRMVYWPKVPHGSSIPSVFSISEPLAYAKVHLPVAGFPFSDFISYTSCYLLAKYNFLTKYASLGFDARFGAASGRLEKMCALPEWYQRMQKQGELGQCEDSNSETDEYSPRISSRRSVLIQDGSLRVLRTWCAVLAPITEQIEVLRRLVDLFQGAVWLCSAVFALENTQNLIRSGNVIGSDIQNGNTSLGMGTTISLEALQMHHDNADSPLQAPPSMSSGANFRGGKPGLTPTFSRPSNGSLLHPSQVAPQAPAAVACGLGALVTLVTEAMDIWRAAVAITLSISFSAKNKLCPISAKMDKPERARISQASHDVLKSIIHLTDELRTIRTKLAPLPTNKYLNVFLDPIDNLADIPEPQGPNSLPYMLSQNVSPDTFLTRTRKALVASAVAPAPEPKESVHPSTIAAPPPSLLFKDPGEITDVDAAIARIQREPGNNRCFECHDPSPSWVSTNLGVLFCLRCSGLHRKLGVHLSQVRSLTLDTWKKEWARSVLAIGNKRAELYWEAAFLPSNVNSAKHSSQASSSSNHDQDFSFNGEEDQFTGVNDSVSTTSSPSKDERLDSSPFGRISRHVPQIARPNAHTSMEDVEKWVTYKYANRLFAAQGPSPNELFEAFLDGKTAPASASTAAGTSANSSVIGANSSSASRAPGHRVSNSVSAISSSTHSAHSHASHTRAATWGGENTRDVDFGDDQTNAFGDSPYSSFALPTAVTAKSHEVSRPSVSVFDVQNIHMESDFHGGSATTSTPTPNSDMQMSGQSKKSGFPSLVTPIFNRNKSQKQGQSSGSSRRNITMGDSELEERLMAFQLLASDLKEVDMPVRYSSSSSRDATSRNLPGGTMPTPAPPSLSASAPSDSTTRLVRGQVSNSNVNTAPNAGAASISMPASSDKPIQGREVHTAPVTTATQANMKRSSDEWTSGIGVQPWSDDTDPFASASNALKPGTFDFQ